MLAVILGAGEGTRMRPLTYTRPKVMLPVLGIPIIEHIVNSCVEARLKRVDNRYGVQRGCYSLSFR